MLFFPKKHLDPRSVNPASCNLLSTASKDDAVVNVVVYAVFAIFQHAVQTPLASLSSSCKAIWHPTGHILDLGKRLFFQLKWEIASRHF